MVLPVPCLLPVVDCWSGNSSVQAVVAAVDCLNGNSSVQAVFNCCCRPQQSLTCTAHAVYQTGSSTPAFQDADITQQLGAVTFARHSTAQRRIEPLQSKESVPPWGGEGRLPHHSDSVPSPPNTPFHPLTPSHPPHTHPHAPVPFPNRFSGLSAGQLMTGSENRVQSAWLNPTVALTRVEKVGRTSDNSLGSSHRVCKVEEGECALIASRPLCLPLSM